MSFGFVMCFFFFFMLVGITFLREINFLTRIFQRINVFEVRYITSVTLVEVEYISI